MAFDDGVIRMACIDLIENKFHLIQVIKSHSGSVNKLLLNATEMILVSGSDDKTIFVHQIVTHLPYCRIRPIGLIKISVEVTAMEWNTQVVSFKLFLSTDRFLFFFFLAIFCIRRML